jgi:hypothetical protein
MRGSQSTGSGGTALLLGAAEQLRLAKRQKRQTFPLQLA